MKILITGSNGMLGNALVKTINQNNIFTTSKRSNIFDYNNFLKYDLANENYNDLLSWVKPDVIIHCAANTDVNYCENNLKTTNLINYQPIEKFFKMYRDTFFIFISSDAVFDGTKKFAKESDPRLPLNIYGTQKKNAEDFIINNFKKFSIIRTTPLGKNIYRNNFLTWILKSIKDDKKISLFSNMFFTPIDLNTLSDSIKFIINNDIYGIYHLVSSDRVSKYDFCIQLLKHLNINKKLLTNSKYIPDNKFAKRSLDQSLDNSKFNILYNNKLPNLQGVIKNIIKDL